MEQLKQQNQSPASRSSSKRNIFRNYQKELDRILSGLESKRQEAEAAGIPYIPPRLLLHGCCAPCSSYVLEYLSRFFSITIWYYNPNISPEEEYRKRAAELQRLVQQLPTRYPVTVEVPAWDPAPFWQVSKGLENEPEGGARCRACFSLRLREAAALARSRGYDWYCTTLSISPLKSAALLNELGETIGSEYGISYLPSDFKKKEGYKRSLELSREYGLYRQDYCGCVFSQAERELQKQRQNQPKETERASGHPTPFANPVSETDTVL